jgi:hypothetical protein
MLAYFGGSKACSGGPGPEVPETVDSMREQRRFIDETVYISKNVFSFAKNVV